MIKHLSPKSEEELKSYYKHQDLPPEHKMEIACEIGLLWLVKEALEQTRQAYPNNVDNQLRWGLLCASYEGKKEIVKYLIEQGAVPDKLVYMWARDNPNVYKETQEEICKLLRCHRKLRNEFCLKQ